MVSSVTEKRVLIVDDEVDIGAILCSELEYSGVNCQVAHNAQAALKLLSEDHFDLVISDIRMPTMTGVDFLRTLRKRTTRLPMILMTGYADLTLAQAHQLGAESLIAKPFNLDDLPALVDYYALSLEQRWKLGLPVRPVRVAPEQLEAGRGGFLVRGPAHPPRVGHAVWLQVGETPHCYHVICRWHWGESWGGEIVGWNQSAHDLGWSQQDQVAYIPQHSIT